ncbi:MAG: hydroxyacid dehydrogenase [Candidatus Bathyarchaeia archaeon]
MKERKVMKHRVLSIPTSRHMKYVFSEECFEKLKSGFDVAFNELDRDYTSDEVAERIGGFDALITGWGSPSLKKTVFKNADQLRIIAHSAGSIKYMLSKDVVQNYIIPRRICVCNAPKAIAYNVAETTLGLLIMTSHRLVDHIISVREGLMWRDPKIPREVKSVNGSTIGIVGASVVGREVIRLLEPFDVEILMYDPYLSEAEAEQLHAKRVSLEELFRRSDLVSVHAPMTEETYRMIDERHLSLMHDGAILVNTSRGKVIDQEALARQCETGRILVALDVTDPEPLPEDFPLRRLKNVMITPHVAGQGSYGMGKIGEMTLQALEDFFAGRKVENVVDFEKYDILA